LLEYIQLKKKHLPEASVAHVNERTRAHVHEDEQRRWPLLWFIVNKGKYLKDETRERQKDESWGTESLRIVSI